MVAAVLAATPLSAQVEGIRLGLMYQPEYQPGFEDADTSVHACIPFYAPTHLDDRSRPSTCS